MIAREQQLPRSRRSAAVVTFLGSGANTLLVSVQAVVLIPIYLHFVGPRLFGAWLASGDLLVWIQILDLGLPNLLIQRVGSAIGSGDYYSAGRWFTTGTIVIGGVATIMAMAGIVFSMFLPNLFDLTGAEADLLTSCFAIGSLAGGVALLNNAFIGLSRALQDTVFLNIVTLVASLAGFGVSLSALLGGAGILAVPYGLVTRAIVSLVGGIWFAIARMPPSLRGHLSFDRGVCRQYLAAVPATGAGGLAYALMSQTETTMVATVMRPELAVVYSLTKKGADVARSIVDMIAFASYAGFAHMVGAGARGSDVGRVYFEIRALRLVMVLAVATAYVAVTCTLMSLWVGSSQYGGLILTVLFAGQLVATGNSYLVNYLYRAAGHVQRGSWLLVAEAGLRIPLMLAGVIVLGLTGLPLAGILVSIPFAWTVERTLLAAIGVPAIAKSEKHLLRSYAIGAVMVTAAALTLGRSRFGGWLPVLSLGSLIFGFALTILVTTSPHLDPGRKALLIWFRRKTVKSAL